MKGLAPDHGAATALHVKLAGDARRERRVSSMKKNIHPKYIACTVHCGCGNNFVTRATVSELRVDICGSCHPYYSGKQKFVDTAGRVEKFRRRYNKAGDPK